MNRPRGDRRYDRREDRAEIIAFAYDVWRRSNELSRRVPFGLAHWGRLCDLGLQAVALLQTLGEDPIPRGHSIGCQPPSRRGDQPVEEG